MFDPGAEPGVLIEEVEARAVLDARDLAHRGEDVARADRLDELELLLPVHEPQDVHRELG